MKPKFSHFLGFTFILFTLVILSANAQEGIPGNEIPDLNFHPELQDEKPLLFEPERSTNSNEKTIQGKEQLIADPKSIKSKSGDSSRNPAAQSSEDDALSFNFLYYIIQKFKISDIVAQ